MLYTYERRSYTFTLPRQVINTGVSGGTLLPCPQGKVRDSSARAERSVKFWNGNGTPVGRRVSQVLQPQGCPYPSTTPPMTGTCEVNPVWYGLGCRTPRGVSHPCLYRNESRYGSLQADEHRLCLLYTSPSPRDLSTSRMPSSA